jgi:L-2-hydroxyglutarate oxidase LhgO
MIITDFLVIGGGIIGINVATELRNLFPDTKVTLIKKEIKKYSRSRMVFLASLLAKHVKTENYKTWGKPGIRRKLEMDFVIEGDDKSIHVLNAVSPGFTCSIPFSRYVCRKIQSQLN